LLARLRAAPPPVRAGDAAAEAEIPPYDAAVLIRESRLAVDWWAEAAAPGGAGEAGAELDALIEAATAEPARDRSALVLRDYHAENLIWLPEREGDARVGLLDYQDALAGSPAYDLVSLLEDARRDTSEELREAMVARALAASGDDAAVFRAAYAALGAQRNLKIVGIFARLWLRDGKPAYLDLIPRVWGHLRRDLAHPALADLAAFVDARVPAPDDAAIARVRAARR
ncbi:MAG: phosphotransferase, partial [Pseudomonadota bacterium]